MGAHCHQLPIIILLLLLASSPEVLAVRSLGVSAQSSANASPAEQPRKLAEGNAADVASAAARFDTSTKNTTATNSSSPSTVFDPDRMSKRRVRRGSDPIHNKC
uniref:Uncharacterized protein n=1 Tax=Leersia perrieri TaxID=77586 RepID=A0A0D9VHH0_9ORYZ